MLSSPSLDFIRQLVQETNAELVTRRDHFAKKGPSSLGSGVRGIFLNNFQTAVEEGFAPPFAKAYTDLPPPDPIPRWRTPDDQLLYVLNLKESKRPCAASGLPFRTNRMTPKHYRPGPNELPLPEIEHVIVGLGIKTAWRGRIAAPGEVVISEVVIGRAADISNSGVVSKWTPNSGLLTLEGEAKVETMAERERRGESLRLPFAG